MKKSVVESDVLVIGGGPAGLICAIEAARGGRQVIILEAQSQPGLKLLATGGGRCNLTNTLEPDEMARRFPEHQMLIGSTLRTFPPESLRHWFQELNVQTHAPDGFHVFPRTHRAATVRDALLQEARRLRVQFVLNCKVHRLEKGEKFLVEGGAGEQFAATTVLVACGGVGYPELGDGSGMWEILKALGHTVSPPVPAMVPLITKERWPGQCRSDTLPKVELSVAGSRSRGTVGDLIFTRKGIAGPVVLDASREIAALLHTQGAVPVRIRLREGWTQEPWRELFLKELEANPTTLVESWLTDHVSPALARTAVELLGIPQRTPLARLPRNLRSSLTEWLGGIPLTVVGTEGIRHAMVTRGGVTLREVDPLTFESRLIPGLHFAGEVLDVDGPCGGYNLQWAFSTGYVAGTLFSHLALD